VKLHAFKLTDKWVKLMLTKQIHFCWLYVVCSQGQECKLSDCTCKISCNMVRALNKWQR